MSASQAKRRRIGLAVLALNVIIDLDRLTNTAALPAAHGTSLILVAPSTRANVRSPVIAGTVIVVAEAACLLWWWSPGQK